MHADHNLANNQSEHKTTGKSAAYIRPCTDIKLLRLGEVLHLHRVDFDVVVFAKLCERLDEGVVVFFNEFPACGLSKRGWVANGIHEGRATYRSM